MGTVGPPPCRRMIRSLCCDYALQCLLMFVDWVESGHLGVPSLQEEDLLAPV